MRVEIARRETGLLKPFLKDAAAWAAERAPVGNGTMPRCLPDYHDAISGTPADEWPRHEDVALLLAQAAGKDALLQDWQGCRDRSFTP